MKPLYDAMYPKTMLTPLMRQAIDEVHDIAHAYVALDPHQQRPFLGEVRNLTTGRQRWLATRHTPPDHHAYEALMTLLDALIADQGLIKTDGGWLDPDVLKELEVKIERDDGEELIVFPAAYPWRSKPDPETHGTGIRADAIYRHKEDRHPYRGTFSQVGPRPEHTEKGFWEE